PSSSTPQAKCEWRDAPSPRSPGPPASPLCPLRPLPHPVDRQLVKGPFASLRLLSLPRLCATVRVAKTELEAAFRQRLESLTPQAEYVQVFNTIVADVWRDRLKHSREQCLRAEKLVELLRARRQSLEDAFIFERRIDRATYERQRERLSHDLTIAELDLQ